MNLLPTFTILKFLKNKNSNYHKLKGRDDVLKMKFKYVLNSFLCVYVGIWHIKK